MMYTSRKLRIDDQGFTLAEVLVTIMILTVVLSSLYGIFNSSIHIFSLGNDKVEAVENARIGLEKMAREVRAAYPVKDPSGGNPYLFFSANGATINPPKQAPLSNTQITFGNELGAGGDGEVICPSSAKCEYVTYKLSGTTLMRNNTSTGSIYATGDQAVIESVKPNGLNFTYLKSGNGPTTNQSEAAKVKITLEIVVEGAEQGGTQTLSTEVVLRNKDVTSLPSSSTIDSDSDGIPDATDTDDDGDGVPDTSDSCPLVAANTANGCLNDNDADGTPDDIDTDDDNDGVPDELDACPTTAGDQPNGCTMPDTTITSTPPSPTTTTAASFSFTSSEGGSTFQCKLDGGSWQSCTSSKSYSSLSAGSHTFQVRATNATGNTDSTPASYTWTINAPDTTPPDTTITSGPSGKVTSTSAAFAFTSTESGTFQCNLDNGGWTACSSPKSYTALAAGNHTFQVRAIDAAQNVDSTPASRTWNVNRPPKATNDSYSLQRGRTHTISAATGLLANDSDDDGDSITVTGNTNPARGTLTMNGNGSFTFTSPANTTTGNVTFTYTISDGRGGTSSATVTINITR